MRARNRPPRLEPRVGEQHARPAEPPTLEELLERSGVTGRSPALAASQLRRIVDRAGAAGGPAALDAAWSVVAETFGASPSDPSIDPECTVAAFGDAVARILEVAAAGGHIAFATSRPASLLVVHAALARVARGAGAPVDDADDGAPTRLDGRSGRRLRWVEGVVTVTDGESLCATRDAEAAREWLFLVPRPALAVADGPFADGAAAAGVELVALAGLDHASVALSGGGPLARRPLVVPMWTDRRPGAYRPLLEHGLAGLAQRAAGPEL